MVSQSDPATAGQAGQVRAIAAWNRRSPPVPAEVRRLVDMIDATLELSEFCQRHAVSLDAAQIVSLLGELRSHLTRASKETS